MKFLPKSRYPFVARFSPASEQKKSALASRSRRYLGRTAQCVSVGALSAATTTLNLTLARAAQGPWLFPPPGPALLRSRLKAARQGKRSAFDDNACTRVWRDRVTLAVSWERRSKSAYLRRAERFGWLERHFIDFLYL